MDPKIAHLWIILKNNTERPVRSVVAQRMNFTMKKKIKLYFTTAHKSRKRTILIICIA